jgi:O-methyltransferase/8-demethyl-8-(2,3-dimethoxy-alpha-L-rhamnosyl)tetracenomycin-C 4'-O-methyltransferase
MPMASWKLVFLVLTVLLAGVCALQDSDERYLQLMEKVLTGLIYGDKSIDPWSRQLEFDISRREQGHDWPAYAHTMIGLKRMRNLRQLMEWTLRHNVSGDYIETGVWRGGATIFMRSVLKAHDVLSRRVFVADSFAGLPKPDPKYAADAGDTHHQHVELVVSLEEVMDNFRKYDLLDSQVIFLKGWFTETLPTAPIDRLAILRLDGDMYESTIVALEALYDKVSRNGFIIVDDYGAVSGCRQAIGDFRAHRGILTPLITIDKLGVYWQKEEDSTTPASPQPASSAKL